MPHFSAYQTNFNSSSLFAAPFSIFLERSLTHAGDLALVSQLTEADTADTVVPKISVGTAAQLAAVVLAGGELGRTGLLDLHRSLCHYCLPP